MEPRKLEKGLTPAVDNEPMMTFRAKDNLSIDVVTRYHELLVTAGEASDSLMLQSVNEWLEKAKEWRAIHPELCQHPTY